MTWIINPERLDPRQKELYEDDSSSNVWIKGHAGSGKSVLMILKMQKFLTEDIINGKRIYRTDFKTCIVVFTHSMIELYSAAINELAIPDISIITYFEFKKQNDNYDYIFCDEVQDLPESILVKMKASLKTGGKLIVAGDSNQSIFDSVPGSNESTIDTEKIPKVIDAKEFGLTYVHRVTRTIINAIQKILPQTNIWSAGKEFTPPDKSIMLRSADKIADEVKYVYSESLKGPDRTGNEISVILLPKIEDIIKFANELLELNNKPIWHAIQDIKYIIPLSTNDKEKAIKILNGKKTFYNRESNQYYFGYYPTIVSVEKWLNILQENGVNANYKEYNWGVDYSRLNKHLFDNDIRIEFVGSGHGSLESAEKEKRTILMSYHSSKGLDFDNVFLPFLSWEQSISAVKPKTLLMVAMTRSKRNLYITYTGNKHEYIELLMNDTNIDINEQVITNTTIIDNIDTDILLPF